MSLIHRIIHSHVAVAAASLFLCVSCSGNTDQIKVMSFNLRVAIHGWDGDNHWDHRKEAVIALIKDQKPDLFGVQEAYSWQAAYLIDELPEYRSYGLSRKDNREANKVFYLKSRFDLLDEGTIWLSETPEVYRSKGWDADQVRLCSWVKLYDRQTGREIYYFNTHFDHKGVVARRESSKLIASRVSEMVDPGIPVFLTGDFNINFNSPDIKPLYDALSDARETAPQSNNWNTFNGFGKFSLEDADENGDPVRIIDHIFYRDATPLCYDTVTKTYGVPYTSDHYAITFVSSIGKK